ncbi:MAG: ATP-binding protein, partial [Candidatus Omnitrophota bacterium]
MNAHILSASNYFFNPHSIPSMAVGLLIFSIGFIVLQQNKRSIINIAFFLQCFTVGLWAFSVGFVYMSRTSEVAFFWYRHFTFLGVSNIMPSFSLLAIAWAGEAHRRKFLIGLNYAVPFVFYILANTTPYIIDIRCMQKFYWGLYPAYTPWALIFIAIYIGQFLTGLTTFYRAYRRETIPVKKAQIGMIIVATLIASTASVDFIPKFVNIAVYPFGYIPIFIYVVLVGYSIVRYKTFDIETAFHKTAMWLLTSSFIIIPMLVLNRVFLPYLQQSAAIQIEFWVISFLLIATYLRGIQPRIDRYFQRQRANLDEISNRFIEDLVHLKGLNQLIHRIDTTIADTFYPQLLDIFIYNESQRSFKLLNKTLPGNGGKPDITSLSLEYKFLLWLTKHNKVAHREFVDIDPAYTFVKSAATDYFSRTGAVIVIPLVLNDKMLGYINLGKKANLRRYSGAEFQFLTTMKSQATIAISNSLLYENIEEQVRQRTKELVDVQKQLVQAEKLATVGTLAGGVAHEINNPLTAVLTNVQMLLTSETITDELDRESLQLIEEATKRCRTIVQKMMTYARKPLETTEVSRVCLSSVLKTVISFIGYQLEQDNITIVSREEKAEYLVMGNHNELEQVFTNIILNARDAIKNTKKSGTIEITFSRHGGLVNVCLSDDGPGIPKEIASKVFDPFFTTKDVGKGVGLGLAICQSIVLKHGGTISFESEEGQGTVFT